MNLAIRPALSDTSPWKSLSFVCHGVEATLTIGESSEIFEHFATFLFVSERLIGRTVHRLCTWIDAVKRRVVSPYILLVPFRDPVSSIYVPVLDTSSSLELGFHTCAWATRLSQGAIVVPLSDMPYTTKCELDMLDDYMGGSFRVLRRQSEGDP